MITSALPKPGNNKISYHWGKENLVITIGNHIQHRIKLLFWAEFLFTCGMTTVLLFSTLPSENEFLNIISVIGSALVYLMAAYRFLSRIFFKELLLLDNNAITIVQKTLFSQKSHSYEWKKTGPLHYGGKQAKTDHPLKGGCYDYFGFETQEHLIQNLHEDGNLHFNYMGNIVKFARGVYSWDAEEMVNMMKLYAGRQLSLGPEWAEMLQQAHEWDDAY